MSNKRRKSKKGLKLRPCFVCDEIVNFILWQEETDRRKRRIFHWANEDGTHHYHNIKDIQQDIQHLKSIMQEE